MGTTQSAIINDLEVGESLKNEGDGNGIYKIWSNVAPARFQGSHNVTVFVKTFGNGDGEETKKFYENCIQNLKIVRHPCIAKFCSAYTSPVEACLIVERVRPLDYCLKTDELTFEPEELLSGLQNVFEAVNFLHENAKLSHNNIAPLSVFVCPDHTWKLGSFEFSLSVEGSSHWCQSDFAKTVKEVQFVPPEDQTVMSVKAPWHARDVFGLGKLVEYLLPYLDNKISDAQLSEIYACTERLCDSDATRRPRISDVNYRQIFENALSDLSSNLRNVPYMTTEEKESFFDSLLVRLRSLSPVVIARRLTNQLLSRYVFVEPSAITGFASQFLKPKLDDDNDDDDDSGVLPIGLFKQYVVPELRKMFCVHETCIRLNLLQLFDGYVESFDRSTLQDLILPELLLGMKDIHESVVASSMRCLARLVPLLGAEAVTGLVHRKYFSEGRPREKLVHSDVDVTLLKSVKSALELEPSPEASTRREETAKETAISEKEKRRRALKIRQKELEQKRKSKALNLAAVKIEKAVLEDVSQTVVVGNRETASKSAQNDDESFQWDEEPASSENKFDSDWTDWSDEAGPSYNFQSIHSLDTEPKSVATVSSEKHAFKLLPDTSTVKEIASVALLREIKEKPLGSEFDISAVEIRADEQPAIDDLFVDMAPVVRKPLTSRINIVSKFDVQQDSAVDFNVDGWGDDD